MKFTPRTYAQAFLNAAQGAQPAELKQLAASLWRTAARHRQLGLARQITAEVATLADREAGVTAVEVAVAREASHAFKHALERGLAASLGGKVAVTYQVKTHLMAGVVVTLGDRRYDASLKGRLEALYHSLAGDRSSLS